MLKPIDIVVLTSLLALEEPERRTFSEMAQRLGSNPSSLHRSIGRLTASGLLHKQRSGSLTPSDYSVDRYGMVEILVHATRYFMPVEPGAPQRGLATAHSGPDLKARIRATTIYVWPYVDGTDHGPSIEPLDACVPHVAARNPLFYRILALVDACRVGRTRDRQLAGECLSQLILQRRIEG